MASFTSYMIVLSLVFGLIAGKPVQDKPSASSTALEQAEEVLNRYAAVMQSDVDQLVHALFSILLKHPTSFPTIPRRALDVAMKNVAQKLGQDSLDTLTKPMLAVVEQHAWNKPKQPSTYQLTDAVRTQIEDALDQFFQEQGITSHM